VAAPALPSPHFVKQMGQVIPALSSPHFVKQMGQVISYFVLDFLTLFSKGAMTCLFFVITPFCEANGSGDLNV
jgi:hypothetical protein